LHEVELEVLVDVAKVLIWQLYEHEVENVDALLHEQTGYENRTQHDVGDVSDNEPAEEQTVIIKTTHDEVEVDGIDEVLLTVGVIITRHINVVHDEVVDIHIQQVLVETTLTKRVYEIYHS
jgi:hypothetical protein